MVMEGIFQTSRHREIWKDKELKIEHSKFIYDTGKCSTR